MDMEYLSATLKDSGLLERKKFDHVTFLREEELYQRSQLTWFVPEVCSNHEENLSAESRKRPRTFLIQGELLVCYIIFSPILDRIEDFSPVFTMDDDEEEKKRKRDPVKMLEQLVRESKFFQGLKFEVSFHTVGKDELNSDSIIEIEPKHKPFFNLDTLKWDKKFSSNSYSFSNSDLQILSTGEIVFPFHIPVSIQENLEGKFVELRASISPPAIPDQQNKQIPEVFNYLFKPISLNKQPPIRTVSHHYQLLYPFSLSCKSHSLNDMDYISISVNNKGYEYVIEEIKIEDNSTSIASYVNENGLFIDVPAPEYFNFSINCGNYPIIQSTHDTFSFVVFSQPNYEKIISSTHFHPSLTSPSEEFVQWTVKTKIMILWRMKNTSSSILSFFPIEWTSNTFEDLIVSIYAPSPAPLNERFDVKFTITNLADVTRNLQLQLNPKRARSAASNGLQSAREACLMSIEKSANIGMLAPRSSSSLIIPFIALEEGLFQLKNVNIVDKTSSKVFVLKKFREIHVLDDRSIPRE